MAKLTEDVHSHMQSRHKGKCRQPAQVTLQSDCSACFLTTLSVQQKAPGFEYSYVECLVLTALA